MAPLGHLLGHLVGDLADGVLGDLRAVDVGELRGDLAGRQPACGQREHDLVDPVQPALPLSHDPGLEAAVPVPRHLDLDRPDLGLHRPGPGAVAGVLPVPAGRLVLVEGPSTDPSATRRANRNRSACSSSTASPCPAPGYRPATRPTARPNRATARRPRHYRDGAPPGAIWTRRGVVPECAVEPSLSSGTEHRVRALPAEVLPVVVLTGPW